MGRRSRGGQVRSSWLEITVAVSPVSPVFVVPSLAGNYKLPPLSACVARRVTWYKSLPVTGCHWMSLDVTRVQGKIVAKTVFPQDNLMGSIRLEL